MTPRWTAAVVLTTAAAVAMPARARSPAEATEASGAAITEAARARSNEGVRSYAKKKYGPALASFLQAYALTKRPAFLFNIGQTMAQAGHPLYAARYFQRYLREAEDATPEEKARAMQALSDVRERLGAIEVVATEGAEIAIDDEPVGRAPLAEPALVLPGAHTVKATISGAVRSEPVRVAARQHAAVRLVVTTTVAERATALPPRAAGEPAIAPDLAPESPGLFSPPATTAPVYVAGAIGIASLTAAVVLGGIRSNAERNEAIALDALARRGQSPSLCPTASPLDPKVGGACSALRTAQRTAAETKGPFVAMLAAGAATTAFALGWYFFAPKAPASEVERAARVTPWLGVGTAGASLSGRF